MANLHIYITYELPFPGRTFTYHELKTLYGYIVDKIEYPDFEIWFTDMLRSGVFERL